jgi:hypothetical protein
MTFENCLSSAVDGGEISRDDAARLKDRFDRMRAQFADASAVNADLEAKKALAELLKAESAHEKRKAKLSISSIKQMTADINSHRNARGERDVAEAALAKLEHFGTAKFSSVAGAHKEILGLAHARMEDALYHFRRSAIAGDAIRHNKADLDNVLREAFGENTGDASSKHFAKVWEDTHEWLRQRFNAAGGAIGKLENWGLPQHHDGRALRNAGMEAWKAYIRPLLDISKMREPLTGRAIDARDMDEILTGIWEGIVTEGWDSRAPTRQAFGKGSLSNQRAESRFLVFRDADSWMKYQKDFGGGGDVFAAMMGHINSMTKDIAAMEVLGPNPSGTIQWLKQVVRKQAMDKASGRPSGFSASQGRAIDKANSTEQKIDALWGSIRGTLETPVNGWWARSLAGTRSIITASVLGSAMLSSGSDIGTSALTRAFNGLTTKGAFADIVKAMQPSTRREAVAAGLILDSAMHVFHQQARYVGTLDGPGWTSFIADRVLTYSGLTPWTQSARHAFGLAFMRTAAEHAGAPFDAIPQGLREAFSRYGITPLDWERMRKLPQHDMGNGTFIMRPNEIAERVSDKLSQKYLGMIQSETEYAVPSGSHQSKIALLNQNQPGTFIGEVLRSFAQFKSFGAVFAILHGQRIHGLIAAGQPGKGALYAASLLISTTLFGALSLQLKSLAAGRDPRNMADPVFLPAALLAGGGLGIYGDFLFSNINRYGGGFATTLGGPLVQRANDFWNLTGGNIIQLASGDKTNFGKEALKFAKGMTPGSNLWYVKLAWERILWDSIQKAVDPEAARSFKNQQRYFQREMGQGYWWKPGEWTPQRAPDLPKAAGQ